MSDTYINQQPVFGCIQCRDDFSWPANDLRVYNGELWCDLCWDHCEMVEETGLHWNELEKFIPQADRRIADLESDLADATDWRNSLVERVAVKPEDWRDEYTRFEVVGNSVGERGVFLSCGIFRKLSDANCTPGAVFEWQDGSITESYTGPNVNNVSNYAHDDPRTWRYEYPVAVWLPGGGAK